MGTLIHRVLVLRFFRIKAEERGTLIYQECQDELIRILRLCCQRVNLSGLSCQLH